MQAQDQRCFGRIAQPQLRLSDEQAQVESIHNVRLVSLNTAKTRKEEDRVGLKDSKESKSVAFDSFDEFTK